MLFYAFKKGMVGYSYEIQINAGSIHSAKQKLVANGYNRGKWILVPQKNIINLENQRLIHSNPPSRNYAD